MSTQEEIIRLQNDYNKLKAQVITYENTQGQPIKVPPKIQKLVNAGIEPEYHSYVSFSRSHCVNTKCKDKECEHQRVSHCWKLKLVDLSVDGVAKMIRLYEKVLDSQSPDPIPEKKTKKSASS